jgi:PAS domain S-box-containing protein
MAGLVVVTLVVFLQSRYPLMFLVPPMMLLVASRLEVLGGVIGAVIVAAIAVLATMAGYGPLQLSTGNQAEQLIVLQAFLAVSIFVSLPVAAFQRQRRYILDRMARASEAVARSEARYRLLTENALDLIIHSDLTGKVTYMSPSSMAMLGYSPEEMIGHRAIELVHPDDFDRVTRFSVEQMEGGTTPTDRIDYRAYRKDGVMLWLESRPTLARDPVTGKKIGITDVVRDVTERKAMENDLREAQTRAEAAAAAKGEFLANMSHELRTPLTAVIGFANLVEGQPELTDATRRHVGRIIDGGRSLLATINDILDFSKLDAGLMEIKLRPASVAGLVGDVVDIFSSEAASRGLTLTAIGLETLPERLMLDPERVRQVLLNLVGNAIKFTNDGGVAVDVAYDGAAQSLHIGVTDTGQGISPADVALLFARFSQIDASITRQHGGAGLGLAISRGLVEAMGGEIGVESRLGEGSRFAFNLPASVPVDAPSDTPPELPSLPAGCRVLVVDDNAANRELVRTVLEAFSVNVSEAVDGEEGVLAAEAGMFDLILMDLRMPRLDGAQAAERIRAGQGPSAAAPIIAFSADVRSGPTAAVFDGAVPKPMTVASLVGTIAAALAA